MNRRTVLRLSGASALATLAGCAGGDGGTPEPGENEVFVGPNGQYRFLPETLTVSTGTTVTWTFQSSNHNVSCRPEGWDSASLPEGAEPFSSYDDGNSFETVAEGETYTLTLTVYDADENFDDRSASDTTDTYSINSVSASSGGGNDISVTADISTSDPGAEIKVQSLRGGTVRDSTRVAVTNSQPQTEVISGANQADQVRVILYDSAGVEVGRQTIPYP